jgi:hypothetical protein
MTTVETTVGVLTREDVSYLRRASDVYAINIDGQNYLRCVKRARWGDQFSEDKRVDIPVQGNGDDGWFVSAYSFPWQTLHAGNEVRLYWFPDANTNDGLREVGMHADTLYVDVRRGKAWARYMAAVSVCPENSARMCKGASPRYR